MRGTFVVLALMCVLAFPAAGCDDDHKSRTPNGGEKAQGGLYLALGDSIAAGSGALDAKAMSYVGLVKNVLSQYFNDVELRNLAVGGHTTQELIDQQLAPTVDALRNEDVMLVTITIGGNDLNILETSPTRRRASRT